MIAPAPSTAPILGLSIVIPGEPCAQGRGRAVRFGGGVRVIDPAKSRSWKGAAQVHAIAAVAQAGLLRPAFDSGPLVMTVDAYYTRKKFPKRVGPARQPKPTRPDGDNILKAVCDALNGIAYSDDGQLVRLTVAKWYAAEGEGPRVEVAITAADNSADTARKE